MTKLYRAIGLMSGTSMDGIDLAFIESDGKKIINHKNFYYKSYQEDFKKRLRNLIYEKPSLEKIKSVENELTLLHADLVKEFLAKNNIDKNSIDLIAFHGHTILHLPEKSITWQIGNGHLLAKKTGINVVLDFRSRDVILGGQGAPLVPIYHFYLLQNQTKPVAVLNIGGISNITYFSSDDENSIEAFDTCFGNAPFDDLMKKRFNLEYDKNGELSSKGKVDFILANQLLENEFFYKKPPKSFDRDDFKKLLIPVTNLKKTEDALATLAYIHAKATSISIDIFAKKPKELFICGGGRKNITIMQEMQKYLPNIKVKVIEEIGYNGDSIEAEAFAFLGIRSLLNIPLSFPKTTGVAKPSCGAVLYKS
jgi:anhydro-N-acetylmuramic acid kinase